MACNTCNTNSCSCGTTSLRYGGPDIDSIGISNGELLEVTIQKLAEFMAMGGTGAVSTLTNNGGGDYTHTPGDTSGTSTTFSTGIHTTSATAPTSPTYGDTWYDTTTGKLRWYSNNGVIDVWYTASALGEFRFKEETIHHNAVGDLAIMPLLHNKKEIHFESTGDLTIDGDDHTAQDDYTYLIVNTTAVDRLISFTNVTEAHVRNGGTIANLSGTGFTIPTNTSMLLTVTNTGTDRYVNGGFYSTASATSVFLSFGTIISLVALTPLPVVIPGLVEAESIEIYTSTGEKITSSLDVTLSGDTFTIESNVSLTNIKIRIIYSI